MILKAFTFNSFGVNGFVLSNDAGEAILIDPSVSSEQEELALARYIEQNKLTAKHLLNRSFYITQRNLSQKVKQRCINHPFPVDIFFAVFFIFSDYVGKNHFFTGFAGERIPLAERVCPQRARERSVRRGLKGEP